MFNIFSITLLCLQAACGNYDLKKGCTKIFDPVCGTDNLLYVSGLSASLNIVQRNTNVRIKNRGMCQKPSPRSDSAQN
uniref:Kazal-like domain-containing protein n=1 Tax=Athene cunicularia TaxID=194338 RepID=A0A663MNP2_ATHCN